MKKLLLGITIMLVVLVNPATAEDADEGAELRRMYEEDQASRASGKISVDEDRRRRFRVFELLAEGRIGDAEQKLFAAMILQHTPRIWIDGVLSSRGAENYLLAHYLARSAAGSGYKNAKWLAAASLDRYLVSMGKPQRYGTQLSTNGETGELEFDPVDPTTTDKERKQWNVPPIKESIRIFKKEYSRDVSK